MSTPPQATLRLDAEQVAAFHRDGFLAIEALTTAAEVRRLRGIYDRLFAVPAAELGTDSLALAGTDGSGRSTLPQIMNPDRHEPALGETLARANAFAVARQLLGPDARRMGDHAIRKPAGYGVETPWHQDEAYWDPALRYRAISIWMPLQEATAENGCLQFVTGSHTAPVLPHHHIGHDPELTGLEVSEPVEAARVAVCALAAGGATVHDSRTLHYAGPNRSEDARRAYVMAFQLPPERRERPRSFPWQRRPG